MQRQATPFKLAFRSSVAFAGVLAPLIKEFKLMPVGRMRLRELAVLIVLAVAVSVGCGPHRTAFKLRPAQDEVFSAASWEGIPWHDEFTGPDAPGGAVPLTRMRVTAADGALRVHMECEGASANDAVDLVFDAGGDRVRTWRYTLLPDGTCTERAADEGGELPLAICDSSIHHVSSLNDAQWRVEIALPLARIGSPGQWIWRVTRTLSGAPNPRPLLWAPSDPVILLPSGQPLARLRTGTRTLDWQVSQTHMAVSGDTNGQHVLWPSARVTSLATWPIEVSLWAGGDAAEARGVAQKIELLPGSSADVVLPSFSSRLRVPEDKIYVSASEPGAARDVSRVEAGLVKGRHVTLSVLEPAYRGNAYASQEVGVLVFRTVLSASTTSLAGNVDVELTDGSGKAVGSVRVPALADVTGRLEIGSLAEGQYSLVARVSRPDGALLSEDRVAFRKLGKPRGSEVRVDDAGNIVVNGHPRLLLGWYGDIPSDDPRKEVIALQNLRSAMILSTADPRPIRESFARGVYSIVSVEPLRVRGISGLGPQRAEIEDEIRTAGHPSPATLAPLTKLVEAVRDEPGLLGYYLADEPEIAGYRSDYLESAYAQLAELDPYHPVVITNMSADGLSTHGVRASDILNPDPYSAHLAEVPAVMRVAHRLERPGQALMATLWQASWKHHFEYIDRGPNPFTLTRAQYLSAVALGARGFTGYIPPFFMPEPILRYGLPAIWRELRFLEPAIVAPAPEAQPTVEGSSEVYAWIRTVGHELYVIASNPGETPAVATIRHPLLRETHEISVIAESRTVPVEEGALRDTFGPGAVHVYATAGAGRVVPTLAATEADVVAHQQSALAPGNLLHESQGTRVYSAKGFVPSFPRFFEYVVNGVRDDQGWHVPAIGPTPPWVEVALPAPKAVGQIVVYTPNLRDFDLALVDAQGARHTAEIRGNLEAEVHVPVRPAVTMVKVRLTAVACRPDALPTGPMVRELEAYSSPPSGRGIAWVAPPVDRPGRSTMRPPSQLQPLWLERFASYAQGVPPASTLRDRWTFDPNALAVVPGRSGGIIAASTAAVGYAAMSRHFAYAASARYFQVQIGDVVGEGYRFFSIALRTGRVSRTPLVAHIGGLYTIDLHALGPLFTDGETSDLLVSFQLGGSGPMPGGGVQEGPRVPFEWLRLTGDPIDALTVSLADGTPVREELKAGDELVFRVSLRQPANDAIVEWRANPAFAPLSLNGDPYLQLARAGNGDGRQWEAHITLGRDSDRFDGTKGFPLVARAVLSGGPLRETSTPLTVRFE
jgi:hypothetical protein